MRHQWIRVASGLLLFCSCTDVQESADTYDINDTSESSDSSATEAFEPLEAYEPFEPRPAPPEPAVTAPPDVQAWASNVRCCNDGTDDNCSNCAPGLNCICAGSKQLVYCDPCGAGSDCEGWVEDGPHNGSWDCHGIARADIAYGDVIENDCMGAGCESTIPACEAAPLDDDVTPYKCAGQDAESESQPWGEYEESGFALCCPVNGMGVLSQNDPYCNPPTDDGGCPEVTQGLFTCESKVGTSMTHPPCVGWRLGYGTLTDTEEQRAFESLDCDETEDGCYEMMYDCDGVLYYHPGHTVAWEAADSNCAA